MGPGTVTRDRFDYAGAVGESWKTQMLLNLIDQRKPDYLAMVIDEGGDEAVFRKEIYPAYKANRQKRPFSNTRLGIRSPGEI